MSAYFLHSARLGFRHWTPDDLPLAEHLWGDPDVMRHMGGPLSPSDAQARLHLEIDRQLEFGIQYWPIFDRASGEHAGCSGLRPFGDDPTVREIGVHIARPFWSGRYGEEAARAVLAHAFGPLNLCAVVAGHGPHNENSRALILRLGFHFTHMAPWGPHNTLHPYYRLDAAAATPDENASVW